MVKFLYLRGNVTYKTVFHNILLMTNPSFSTSGLCRVSKKLIFYIP